MKITILYDNEAARTNLQADWGFACLVEMDGRTLLFDTGAQGDLLRRNMDMLGVDAGRIPEVFISHNHWDHVGGLTEILRLNPDATVYVPHSCPGPGEAKPAVSIDGPYELSEKVFSTGELQDIEQSLVVKTAGGLVVVCGCAHPGVEAILQAASRFGKVSALIGGLHGFREIELLTGLNLICPCHCTQEKSAILTRFPQTSVSGGAGKILEFQ